LLTFSVRYKKPGSLFWRKIDNITTDGITEGAQSRFFVLKDQTRIELPVSCHFIFGSERADLIEYLRREEKNKINNPLAHAE
jgi:branched-subunit amino acid aminotransferase/4-amino-4-deoxychorismate lyase